MRWRHGCCAVLLVFSISACPDSENNSQPPLAPLYAGGGADAVVYAWDHGLTDVGVPPNRSITGPDTGLTANYGIDYDRRADTLVVANHDNASVLFFDDVTGTSGNSAPDRVMSGALTGMLVVFDVAVDEVRNLLYVSGSHGINVYANADTLTGEVSPVRVIAGANTTFSGSAQMRMALDSENDRLYVSDPDRSPRGVLIFESVSTIQGNVAPARVLAGNNTLLEYPDGVAIDTQRDLLYVTDLGFGAIRVYDNARLLDGNIAPVRNIGGMNSGINAPRDIHVDVAGDTIYVNDIGHIASWGQASTLSGDVEPCRSLFGGIGNTGSVVASW